MYRLELKFLGPPRIILDDAPVEISRRKAVALLVYLAMTRQPHSRDTLAALFWPDVDQSRAYAYLRTTLWTLNKALGNEWIDAERDSVVMRAGENWSIDAAQFRMLAEGMSTGDPEQDAARLAEAAALYQDDFLAGFTLPDSPAFDEWQFFEQDNLRRELGRVLDDLIRCYVALGRFEAAISYAQRRLALDTLHEPGHRQLIRLFAQAGQWSAALRQYQQCVSTLDAELGADPEPETLALYEAIQARRVPDEPTRPTVRHETSIFPPGNIPAQSTPFIARERELDEISGLLSDPACRLLTLVGQGGIGKTRLALQVASTLVDHYPDGTYFVPLAPVNAAEFIVPALADALQFSAARKVDPTTQLIRYLHGKRLLLVMDNFEHLLDGVDLMTELLTGAPEIKILVTSRERLQLQEEWLYEIHGLAYPDEPIANVNQYGAVRLFVESGRRVRPDFALNADNIAAVLRICKLVEGMPLGLLLAAAWLQMLAPHEIAHEIERSLDFLESSLRGLPERHRSLRAVFESSWERLTPIERHVLSKLAVFRGNFTREAAHTVAEASLPLLLALVNKSLLYRGADDHYTMHELLRQFAEEKLNADPARREQTYDRFTRYYAVFMHEREPLLKGRAQIKALNEIEADIDNLRLAWMLAIGRRDPVVIRGLLVGFSLFYLMRSRQHESREMFGGTIQYLAGLDDLSEEEQGFLALIKVNQALATRALDERLGPLALYQEALPVLADRDDGDAIVMLIMLGDLGIWPAQDRETAVELANRALVLAETRHDAWGKGHALHLLGDVAHHSIDYDNSQRLYQQSLAIRRAIGDRWGEGTDLNMLGEVAYTLGDYAGAEQLYRESLSLSEAVGDQNNRAWCMDRLADVIALQGRYAEARTIALAGIEIGRALGSRSRIAYGFLSLVEIAAGEQDYDEALRCFEQAVQAFVDTDSVEGPAWLAISRCQIALALEDADGLGHYAQEAMAIFAESGSPWGRSAALHYLGETARMKGDYELARDYLRHAVQLADTSKSIMLLTRYLVGFAAWFAETGAPLRAVELLAFVIQNRATWAVTRVRAVSLLDDLAERLPPQAFAAAERRGAGLTAAGITAGLIMG